MDRGANENKSYNVNVDMLPLVGGAESGESYKSRLSELAGCAYEDIVSKELFLYPCESGKVWGVDKEYISSPRLDDLQCAFACLKGFVGAESSDSASVLCIFDNEEVGSATKQGADSDFLRSVLLRVCDALGMGYGGYMAALGVMGLEIDFGIYCNVDYLARVIPTQFKLNLDLWVARWTSGALGLNQHNIKLWQYTSKGEIDGISGNVDISREV